MSLVDRFTELALTVVLIVGGYQFYFWAQRQAFYPARYIGTRWDERVVFDPRWVWVYSGLYYPMILLAALAQPDWHAFAMTAGGFLFLLAGQMYFFVRWPVAIPADWRESVLMSVKLRGRCFKGRVGISVARACYPRSMRFLDTVWSYDKLRNSMPSMHVSVATMVDLVISHAWPGFTWVGWLFPVLIGVSAIKTKQHYLADVVPGAAMGAAAFYAWAWILEPGL